MHPPLLYFVLLLEGFITISIEILAIRSLLPFVGNSVVITSLIIGIFLLFLSLGYWRGGKISTDFEKRLSQNFFRAALLSGVGLSFLVISGFFFLALKYVSLSFIPILTIYLLLIIAPTVYLLGQTIPITTNLFKNNHRVSEISGNALFINTLGSFLGAVLTSLILLHYFGVAFTVFLNCFLMILLSMLLKKPKLQYVDMLPLFITICIAYFFNIYSESTTFIKTNDYGNYQIQKKSLVKTFKINFATMSILSHDNKASPYIEKIKQILFEEMHLRHKNILMIGAGGFTLSAEGTFTNHMTYLDIDPQIKTLAEKHFLEHPVQGQFISGDARAFFFKGGKPYDVIISDTYKALNTLPAYLLTQDYFKQLYERLTPGGLGIFNIIASPFLEDNYSNNLDKTLTSVFKHCMKIPLSFEKAFANILYVCKKTQYHNTPVIYTDNLNQSSWQQLRELPI